MNLKALSVASMVVVSERWLTGEGRKVIDGLALCRAMLGKLEEAHAGLLNLQPQRSALTDALKSARDAASRADDTFDTRGRGLFWGLQSLAALSEDPDEAAGFDAAREAIFPKGLSIFVRTYVEEVGEARLAKERLTPALREALEAAPIGRVTAAEAFDRWLSAADDLEAALRARDAAEAALLNAADAVSLAAAQQAKLTWIRTTRALLNNLDLEDTDADTRAALLKTLREEVAREAKAAKDAKDAKASKDAKPADANTSGAT